MLKALRSGPACTCPASVIQAFLLLACLAGCGGGGGKGTYPDAIVVDEDAGQGATGGAVGGGDSGGTNGTGGAVGAGGAIASTGGTGSGGRSGSGGAVATGGRMGSGGSVGTGGSSATGGAANTGGRAQTGGANPSGGTVGSGGTVAPGTGGASTGTGGAGTCAAVGQTCPTDLNCCSGSTCAVIGTALLCSAKCSAGAECVSGCCKAAYTGSTQLACAPAADCATYEGTVLAADFSGKLLIQTSTGPAFFTVSGCLSPSVGTKVTFASSPTVCASNHITYAGSSTSCLVFCDGSANYTGVVASATSFNKFVITTLFGNQMFDAQTICTGVLAGDNVVFTSTTGACVTNTFADIRSGEFCNVWCR